MNITIWDKYIQKFISINPKINDIIELMNISLKVGKEEYIRNSTSKYSGK
jgi:hypothetical protein